MPPYKRVYKEQKTRVPYYSREITTAFSFIVSQQSKLELLVPK